MSSSHNRLKCDSSDMTCCIHCGGTCCRFFIKSSEAQNILSILPVSFLYDARMIESTDVATRVTTIKDLVEWNILFGLIVMIHT
jgi:hypothetical protein